MLALVRQEYIREAVGSVKRDGAVARCLCLMLALFLYRETDDANTTVKARQCRHWPDEQFRM